MDVTFITNPVAGGWKPADLEDFLGGDEEALTLLSRALVRAGHQVSVFTSLPGGIQGIDDSGVKYKPLHTFDIDATFDRLVAWKDRTPWLRSPDAKRKIHFLGGPEMRWSVGCLNAVDKIVGVGLYEKSQVPWIPEAKWAMVPYGIEPKLYQPPEKPKEHLAIYATSPDRGLETLLQDWQRIRQAHSGLNLFVTYGWKNVDKMGNANAQAAKARILGMLQQEGIGSSLLTRTQMAQLFRAAKYIIHPLNNPNSDLLGFSMLKAQACGVIPVIPQAKGCGFQESVRSFIPYRDFLEGKTDQMDNSLAWTRPISWDQIVREYWEPLLRGEEAKEVAA